MTPKFTIKIKQENSLLSILLDREISETQARIITKMLRATDIADEADIEDLEYTFDTALEELTHERRLDMAESVVVQTLNAHGEVIDQRTEWHTDEDHTGAGDSVEAYRG